MATTIWKSTSDTAWTTAANWSTGTIPANSDTVVIDGTGTANITGTLAQSGVTPALVSIGSASTAQIGTDTAGTATYLAIGAAKVNLGMSEGGSYQAGSALVLLDLGSTTCTINQDSSYSGLFGNRYPAVCVKGSVLTVNLRGGNLGIACRPAETATLVAGKVTMGGSGSPTLFLGPGATVTDLVVETGTVRSRATATCSTLTISGGTFIAEADATGAYTTINVDAGKCDYRGSGTITTLNVTGEFNASACAAATITTINAYKGCVLNLDNGKPGGITVTNPINFVKCSPQECTLRLPANVKLTVAAI